MGVTRQHVNRRGAKSGLGTPTYRKFENVSAPGTTEILGATIVTAGTPTIVQITYPLGVETDPFVAQPDVARAIAVAVTGTAGSPVRGMATISGEDRWGDSYLNQSILHFTGVHAGQDTSRGYGKVTRVKLEVVGPAGSTMTFTIGYGTGLQPPCSFRESDGSEFLLLRDDGAGSDLLATTTYYPSPRNLIVLPQPGGAWIDDFSVEMMSLDSDFAGAHSR